MSEEEINESDIESSLFIKTEGAISRIKLVVDGIKSGNPLLLEGETGTSKTATAKFAAKEIKQHVILFSFSSQTSVEDLLGRISKSSDDWGGFSFKKGPFTIAFEKGFCIILDEINLAHETVLQCIESSLDSRTLSLDFSGSEVDKTIQMHPDFHIIATQNPLTSRFSQKRNYLSNKFTSRFQTIKFGEIERIELIEIATGLSKDIDSITPEFITKLIEFHFQWQKNKYSCSISTKAEPGNSSSNNYVFTIREICRTIKSIEKGLTPFESIMVNYGSRYNNDSQNAMKELLHSLEIEEEYKFFKSSFYIKYILDNNSYHPDTKIVKTELNNRFYMTKTLSDAYSTCFHLLDNYQPILLVGPNGCGKTSIGRWIGDLYTSYIATQNKTLDDEDEMKHIYKFFICNPEMTISDIIGRYLPNKQSTASFANPSEDLRNNYSDAPIEWMYGPVVNAMINGDCLILDQIDTAPSTILERLNSLFDGLGIKGFKFPIQENLENPEVVVDHKFRIIATSSLIGLNDLSPAFLNRFTIVYINEQLNSIKDQIPQFIRCLSPYSFDESKGTKDINFISNSVEKTLIKDNILTSLNLSKCVNGFFKLTQRFPQASKESILKFCFDACIYHTSTIPEMDTEFINVLLSSLAEDDRKDTEFDAFHFKEAESTRKVMATLVACSVIGLHVILVGKTGSGKTTAAMAFSRMNQFSSKTSTTPIIAFNGETQLDELYGYFTIEKGNFTLHQGELSKAMSGGEVFIADELNLADQQIIQSLNVAIEPSCGEHIILPVTGSSIEIKEGFFFIGCQNDLTMNGRRPIPESIRKKILIVDYPENSSQDLQALCTSIASHFTFDHSIPKYTADLIERMKNEPSLRIKPWSLREVRTLFRRIAYFKTKQDLEGFTVLHHISFMLASSYQNYDEMIDKIAELVCTSFKRKTMIRQLIQDLKAEIKVEKYLDESFVERERNADNDNDDDDGKIRKDESKSHYKIRLTKGSLKLNISNTQLNDVPENIQTLWQTVFNIYLTTQSEPLLFVGPSGFKTYLSELFSSLAPVIYLHSDSTISSLVGQIALLDYYQAKLCLIEALDDFAGHDMTIKEPLNEIKKQLEENDEIDEEKLKEVVDKIKENVPESFIPIVENVANRLIGIQNEEKDLQNVKVIGDKMFSNYISIFKAGLITKSIFSQNSLILKNFAQPAPSVIERFNELLSVTPQLTLFEDTTNTYTTPTNNKIYGFSNVFRIIAICLPPEKRNLSDAMISRLTEIYIPTYSQDDQKNVFKTYLEKQFEHDISLTIKPLSILMKALQAFEENELNISFRQKIKIIQIANQWQKKFPDMDVLTIYIISIMRCAGGPLPFELKQSLFEIMEKTFKTESNAKEFPSQLATIYKSDANENALNDSYKYTMEFPCLSLINDGNAISSLLTNFSYPNISLFNNKLNEEKPSFRFSYSNYDLIDLIFSLSIINYPLIIEGPNGCGKSSSFFYVAECLGVKVIQISISRSTTVEDLFGRFEPNAESENLQFDFKPTAFLNAIDKDRNSYEKYWILIEELHLASPSVIDALEPIFNPQSDHVTLPDGSYVQRGNFFICGLLSKSLQKQSITNTAMYYKVRNYTKYEFKEICEFILESNEYGGHIAKTICPILEKLYEISASSHIKIPVTPREAHKFVKMMNAAIQHPHKTDQLSEFEISQILFLGRFVEEGLKDNIKEMLVDIMKEQGYTPNEEIPEFTTENGGSTLTSQKVSIDVSMRTQSRHNEIDHLTESERQLFEFLILNVQEYTPIIVQGPTAAGKTFSIQLFADVLGKNLKVLQMNSEINSSYIAGSYQPSKELSSNDIAELQGALNLITGFAHLLPPKFTKKIQKNSIKEWTPGEFTELKKRVADLLASSLRKKDDDDDDDDEESPKLENEDDIENAKEFINKVNSSLLFFNHLNRNDSLIIKALTEGYWLLLDGIESAPSDFLDRLSTLLDDPPILNLYERGSDYIYSTDPEKSERSQRIHPDFRLFMTYNPVNTNANNVSSSFLSRCSLFSMNPVDTNLYDSAVVVSGIIEQCFFAFSTPSEISARIARIHMMMKSENHEKQLTCRTLIHASREISYKNKSEKIDLQQLKDIIFNHYFQGHQDDKDYESNKELFYENINEIFEEKIDDKLLEQLQKIERNTSKACNTMINIINDLNSQLIKIINSNQEDEIPRFKYEEFLNNLSTLQLKDISQIATQFKNPMKFIREHISDLTDEQISYLAPVATISDLVNQIQSVISSRKETTKIQNLFLDSDYIRSIQSFSTVLFQIHAFTSMHHRGLYMNKIPSILIDVDFAKSYLTLFKFYENDKTIPSKLLSSIKKSKYYKSNLPEDMHSFDYSPYKWDDDASPLQQICSSLFKCKKCRYLFAGIMKDLFVVTFAVFKKENINILSGWVNWLESFFKAFGSLDYNIRFDQFEYLLEEWKESENQDFIIELMNKIEKLRSIPQGVDFEDSLVQTTEYRNLFNSINNLYDNLKEKFFAITENKKAAKDFFSLRDRIFKLKERNDNPLKKPYEYLYEKMDLLSQNITVDNYNFINKVFLSITQPSTKKVKSNKTLAWPTNQNLKQVEEKRSKLLESLISYSKELEKVESLEDSPKWMTLCELTEPDSLMTEFIKQQSISSETISCYKSILRAQLLIDLFEIDQKDRYIYCNTHRLIMFFNQFNDRYILSDDNWAIIAQKLSQIYPVDFCISIPTFSPFDILSLVINPLSKKQGCIFNEKQCPPQLVDSFYELYEIVSRKESKQAFKYVTNQIESIVIDYAKNHYPDVIRKHFDASELEDLILFYNRIQENNVLNDMKDICEQVNIVINFSNAITAKLSKDQFRDINFEFLDYSDIMDINFRDFNSYVNKNPCSGFYIAQFPQVKDNINKIVEICSDEEAASSKFPLALFAFRIFSRVKCIQFQIPNDFPHDLADDFQEFLYELISSNLKEHRFAVFSNFISFLLSNTPNFINDLCYSEHLRNIVTNLISSPIEKLLKQEILLFFKRFLPEILVKLGSPKWKNYVNEELKYDSKDKIISFLTNPWKFALEDINSYVREDFNLKELDVQKAVRNIINLIDDISSEKSIEKLKECVSKDESDLKDKIYHEFLNSKAKNEKETETEKEMNEQWTNFSKYVKAYFGKIPALPTSNSNTEFQPENNFERFHALFSKKLESLPCKKSEIICVIPKKPGNFRLNYTHNGKKLVAKISSPEGKCMLFDPPKNCTIASLNLQCDGAEIKIDTIHSDTEVVKFKYSSMKAIEETYARFEKAYNKIQEEDDEGNDHTQIMKKVGKVKISFGELTLDEFIEKLKSIHTQYHNEKIENIYRQIDDLEKFRNDILELENYTNILFPIDHMEKPHQTSNFLTENLTNLITSARNNLVKSNFAFYSDQYIQKQKFFNDSGSEFNNLTKQAGKFVLKPKNVTSYNVEVSDKEMNQIEVSEKLLTPSVFKNDEKLKVTIKKINVTADPLVFGVDISPLQIKLNNFTEEEIICNFEQDNEDLPLPNYTNTPGFLNIEIPVDTICMSALKYAKKDDEDSQNEQQQESPLTTSQQKKKQSVKKSYNFIDIEKTFDFNGVISLFTVDNPNATSKISYHITLHYISLTTFITIKNNHFFAYNEDKVEIVPFLAGPNSKLIFEKFTDKATKRSNLLNYITELNDNKAQRPEFQSKTNSSDERITDITTAFHDEKKLANSYLSMNYEFGLTREKIIQASLHINTLPKLNKIPQLTLAMFSDTSKSFSEKDILVNVGNLKRRVYFFVGVLNTSDTPIFPKSVELWSSNDNYINAYYDSSKNTNPIQPNQYGYAIYYFEVRYTGQYPFPNKDRIDGAIEVSINGLRSSLQFKYKINAIENRADKFKFNSSLMSDFYYYDSKKDTFNKCDIRNIKKDPVFAELEKQIIISPFCYSIYDKSSSLTRVEYDYRKGTLARLFFDRTNPVQYELFGFFPESRRFMIVTIDKPEKIASHEKNIYLFARVKDDPSTYFPLFCPIRGKNYQFDLHKINEASSIYRVFVNFLLGMMAPQDQDVRKAYKGYSTPEYLFDNTPMGSFYNFSYVIDLLGKGRKTIQFKEVVKSIFNFTNNDRFKDHFFESNEKFKTETNAPFYSFVSAMNELLNTRFEELQEANFYLKLPIPFDLISTKQNELFTKVIFDESQANNDKYINDFKKSIQKINNIEKDEIKKFTDNGMKITPILKWTEIDGLSSSTIEELNAHKNSKIPTNIKIDAIKDESSEFMNNNKINFIEFPEKITIKSLYEKFNEILSSTYILTFNVYSLKKNHQPLSRTRTVLNQLIAIFYWQKECQSCFPFTSFTTYFNPAFSSMMQRLYNSKLSILGFPIKSLEQKESNDFVQIPNLIIDNITIPKFTQPGLITSVTEFRPINKKAKDDNNNNNNEKKDDNKKDGKDDNKDQNVVLKHKMGGKQQKFKTVKTSKKVIFEEINENTQEIPDIEFIQYLIQEMIKDPDLRETFKYKPSEKTNVIPRSIQNLDINTDHNDRIDGFLEASKRLTDTIIKEVNTSITEDNYQYNLLENKDSIYASILIDCTSTLSSSYKAGLATLAIALANTLTAIKIPYAIVLFCESNFQFILKTTEQPHELCHFEKLLDTITVRRRMSDIPTAILMAAEKVKCADKNRENHAMFVLTDGLTNKIKLTEQWKNNILNDIHRSIMFFFMDILSNTDQSVVHPIWDNFRDSIVNSKSANAVVYSKASDIYNGKSTFAEAFLQILSKFSNIGEKNEQPLIAEFPEPLDDISNDLLESITKILQKDVPDEKKFFSRLTFGNDKATQYTQVDLNLVQPKPLDAFTAGIGEKNPELVTEFLKTLTSFANSLVDPSLIQEIGTLIFPPNKPSQFTPSGKGSIFYFPGLIKFILTQGQDTKIFLEKKAGLIRSYSVFFVIDNSSSCINTTTISHAFQTIYSLLYPLSKIDIPSLNIIITTAEGPVVLCSEKPTMMALDDNSQLWVALFSHLMNPHPTKSSFYSALMNAYQMRIQQKSFASVLFTITDGFYSFDERNNFNSIFESFKALNTIPITVGIGSDPLFIDLLTDKSIWSQNPKHIWPAVLYLFGKEARSFDTIKTAFSISAFTQSLANSLENYLNLPTKMFEDLFSELNKVVRKAATYRNYYNENESPGMNSIISQIPTNENDAKASIRNVPSKDGKGEIQGGGEGTVVMGGGANQDSASDDETKDETRARNAVGNFDLGKKDGYKGVKILIIMCWDCTCSTQEDSRLNENVLRNGVDESKVSVVNALSFFGISTTIVKGYKKAIDELGSGQYSEAWIICGRMDGKMPSDSESDSKSNDACLIRPFIDCVIQFWHLGGGLVFWTDNYPLAAEVNIFLSKVKFNAPKKKAKKDKNADESNEKVEYKDYQPNFHIGGDYPGEQTLRRHRFSSHTTNSLSAGSKSNATFDGNQTVVNDGIEKELFNHELKYIFEGYSIASAIKGKEKPNEWENYKSMDLTFASANDIYPFLPFSKSSSGGFSSLYYISPQDCKDGNVIIDCGFSKLFFELKEEGIDRYVKNIAVWMLDIEKKDANIRGAQTVAPYLIHPGKFNFQINYDDTEVNFRQFNMSKKVDLVFLIDGTGSMRFFIDAARDSCNEIANQFHENFPGSFFRFGAVIYRDTAVSSRIQGATKVDQVEKCELNEDPQLLYDFLDNVQAVGGGGDGPEDWVSGYDCLLNEMNWNQGSSKIVIHICDAPGHGTSFTADPKYLSLVRNPNIFDRSKSFAENVKIYDLMQSEQDTEFKNLIKQAAQEQIMFFCMNGHRKAMYCFKATQNFYYANNGPKFIIQNQFAFGFDKENGEAANVDKEELSKQVIKIAITAVDIAVAVSRRPNASKPKQKHDDDDDDSDNEENEDASKYEEDCNKQFTADFDEFNIELDERKREIFKKRRAARGRGGRGRGRGGRGRGGRGGFAFNTKKQGPGGRSHDDLSSDDDLDDDNDDFAIDGDSDISSDDEINTTSRTTNVFDVDDDDAIEADDDDDDSGNSRATFQRSRPSQRGRGKSNPRGGRNNSSRGNRGATNTRGGPSKRRSAPPPPDDDDDDDIEDDFF